MERKRVDSDEALLELAQELLLTAIASAPVTRASREPFDADADAVLEPCAVDESLIAALERAQAHLARRRSELPPLPS